jgi:thymidylate synthase
MPTEGKPDLITKEAINWTAEIPVDRPGMTFHNNYTLVDQLAQEIQPNREWADEHFEERVGGKPMNPDPSYERWPFWHGQESSKQAGEQFTHTYSERFWPKEAGEFYGRWPISGIRYNYGDLQDLVELLANEPYTRQAYLPIFFPEDTGAVHGGRIPCTLGYHFMMRGDQLHMWYHIRSCDLHRHFRDDLYLAVRLQLWVLDALENYSRYWTAVSPGNLYFAAYSLHLHRGDERNVIDH